MCARRFLFVVFILTLLAVGGAFAIFQFGDRRADPERDPQGPLHRPAAGHRARLCQCRQLARAPRLGRRPIAVAADGGRRGRRPPSRRICSTSTRRPISSATIGTRRCRVMPTATTAPDCSCRARPARSTTSADVWAPRYRQAAFGAFLLKSETRPRRSTSPMATSRRPSTSFIAQIPPGEPIILAGHSQGALHLMRLLKERVAGKPLQKRVVAAYVVGWPLSVTADLPALGLPACAAPDQAGCLCRWQSFAEPANPELVVDAYQGSPGLAGGERKRGDILCVNPLTGTLNGAAPPQANPGTLVPERGPRLGDASAGPSRRALRQRPADARRRNPGARALRAAGQQLPRLRLRLVLGRDPARRGAAAGGVAAVDRRHPPPSSQRPCPMAASSAGSMSAPRPSASPSATRSGISPARAETIRRTKFTADLAAARAPSSRDSMSSAWSSACRSTWTAATAPHPVGPRLRPQPRPARPAGPAVGRALVDRRRSSGR